MMDTVAIAFHMYKDDCSIVLMLSHHCYPTILLKYPAVADHHSFCVLYKQYCQRVCYFGDRGIER